MRRAAATRLILVAAAGAAIALPGCEARPPAFALQSSPDQNVLLVTIDTLRADALGAYGGRAATPKLDALASSGARFTFAHAHAVMTLPSHASILTGLYPFQHGIRDNAGYRLGPSTLTIARLAKDAGYATGAFVAAFPLDSRFGLDEGFDQYDDRLPDGRDGLAFVLPERRADAVTAAARSWIEKQQGRWLAWVHLFDPHAPYAPPPPFDGTYRARPYDGEVAYVDSVVGTLVGSIDSQPRPTLVIVTSDHGEGLGDHGEPTHGLFAYESTLRVPLIVTRLAPGAGATAGVVVDAPARHVDIFPTIADAVGLPLPPGLPGRSLVPVASAGGAASARAAEAVGYFEAMSASLTRGWAPLSGVISGRGKYIDLPLPELYELSSDPNENSNLADTQPDRMRVFDRLLEAFGSTNAHTPGAADRETAGRLAALGYMTASAPRKARYTEDDDPKRLLGLERLLHEGVDLAQRGRTQDAVGRYRRIIARRPDMSVAYRHLAAIYVDAGEPDLAVRALNDAVAAGVRDPGLDLELFETTGMVRLTRGDVRGARDAFNRALAISDASAPAHNGLGVIALGEGRRDEAIRHWQAAVGADSGDYDALFNLATELLNARRMDEARPLVERFVAEAPRDRYGADVERLARVLR